MLPKYPNITVNLTSINGNAFSLIGATVKALRVNHIPKEEIDAFKEEAMSGDYDHVIQTIMKTVETE